MSRSEFQRSDWYNATTLEERVALLRQGGGKLHDLKADDEVAARHLKRWRSVVKNDAGFARCLASYGITESELGRLSAAPAEIISACHPEPPAWLVELGAAFEQYPDATAGERVNNADARRTSPFMEVMLPLIHQGRRRLRDGIKELVEAHPDAPFNPDTVEEILYASLEETILPLVTRTLVLELNVARLQGSLDGESGEERFQSFLARLRQPEHLLDLLREYPVMARQVMRRAERWATVNLEFIRRLCADRHALRATFSPADEPGVLVELEGNRGDSHRGGRSVMIATFSSGLKLVYKPKSPAVDVHFQELLDWLNRRGAEPAFGTLRLLDRGEYGWSEFVSPRGVDSRVEVERFYARQGGYLALLYMLEAIDFHYANLIAAGEHPVLIDLEALFHPRFSAAGLPHINRQVQETLGNSVLRIGLLPSRIGANAISDGLDISGLSALPGQVLPVEMPRWENAWTDEMCLVPRPAEFGGGSNRPTLKGEGVHVLDYVEPLLAGFTATYRLLLAHRRELLSDEGPLARFDSDQVRVVLRPTRFYAALLQASFHPNFLRNATDRDRCFDHLWGNTEHYPWLAPAVAAERADLHENDIPFFTTRPDSLHLWSSKGDLIENFFDESGATLVRRRLRQLSESDLARQQWFIRASISTLSAGVERRRPDSDPPGESRVAAERESLLAAARALGDRLDTLALRSEDEATWLGLIPTNEDNWSLGPLGVDLYNGTAGIALFLAYLGSITGEERYTELASAAANRTRRLIKDDTACLSTIGGFSGLGGVIYSLSHLGALWGDSSLFALCEDLVDILPDLIDRDEQLDFIGGAAGCIGALLSLHSHAPGERTRAAALKCGELLLARAVPMESGVGWLTSMRATKPLGGLSHGASGVAWSLLRLAAHTGERRFRDAASAAMRYQHSLFCEKRRNWLDLRGSDEQSDAGAKVMTAWCHGAAGIGLSLIHSLPEVSSPEVLADIHTALEITLGEGFGHNHSLCHGDLGNVELLLEAGRTFEDSQWKLQAERVTARILASIDRHGWRCGTPMQVETPGLMTGLAGIGYGLLRLAEPAQVPSVLMLLPPHPLRDLLG